jgi:hypothetical protein
MYFFQGNRSTEKRQADQQRNHLSWPQDANDDSKTIQNGCPKAQPIPILVLAKNKCLV